MNADAAQYFGYAVMQIVARRIARLHQTDKEAAADDFNQHASAMNECERAEFEKAITRAAIELAAQAS